MLSQHRENCSAGHSDCKEQGRTTLSSDLWNFICWVWLSSVCSQIGVGNAGLNKSLSLIWASESLSTYAQTFSDFPASVCGILPLGASQWTGSSGRCPRRTKGVIQEPLVRTQTCMRCLGQHVALAKGGMESRDFISNNPHYVVHRKTITRSLWTVKLHCSSHVKADVALCLFNVHLLAWLHQAFVAAWGSFSWGARHVNSLFGMQDL